MRTLFISDLHLSPQQPKLTEAFIRFLQNEASNADALYILGDLFDFWVGDDDSTEFAQAIKATLKSFTDSGIDCYFIQGNRDFLIGSRFERETGVVVLPEITEITLNGSRCVLLHGDTLCLEDERYLAFRQKVHNPWLQWGFNKLPFKVRQKIAIKVQTGTQQDKSKKSLDIMDVTHEEVIRVMTNHSAEIMIHGHTHSPNIEQIDNQGICLTRIVLGDWGSKLYYLDFNDDGYTLKDEPI
ncbi:UDP-2,3-diacylglucosamine diphosphatase [Vibrio sp. RC27]